MYYYILQECRNLNVSFHLLLGKASNVIPDFVSKNEIGGVVTDFSPLKIPLEWVRELKEKLPNHVTLCQVCVHNDYFNYFVFRHVLIGLQNVVI